MGAWLPVSQELVGSALALALSQGGNSCEMGKGCKSAGLFQKEIVSPSSLQKGAICCLSLRCCRLPQVSFAYSVR